MAADATADGLPRFVWTDAQHRPLHLPDRDLERDRRTATLAHPIRNREGDDCVCGQSFGNRPAAVTTTSSRATTPLGSPTTSQTQVSDLAVKGVRIRRTRSALDGQAGDHTIPSKGTRLDAS